MKFSISHIITGLALLSILTSCDEIIEKDLDKKRVEITAPTNNLTTTLLSHTFLWEEVEGADGYLLQIVSPSFEEIQQLFVNEDLTATNYDFTLSPGKYEWRIKAYNNTSSTPYTTYKLVIDSTLNLNGVKPILSVPQNDFAINSGIINFEWLEIAIADNYILEIRTPGWENGSPAINPIITNLEKYTNTSNALPEGSYSWAVKAENDFSRSEYSDFRNFEVDLTAPSTPVLSFPNLNASLGDSSFTFRWNRPSNTGSSIKDSLYIYTDPNKTNLRLGSEQDGTTYRDSLGTGTYYWLVKSIDKAGNKSPSSELRSFTIL